MNFKNKKIRKHPELNNLIKKHFSEFDNCKLDLEIINNPTKEFIEDFFNKLENHKNYAQLKDKFVYDEEYDVFIHVHGIIPYEEIEDLTEDETLFYSFMNKKEIKQIFNINSSSDYLLRLRAEQVEGNMRLLRTFTSLKSKFKEKWSFTNHFDSKLYSEYLKNLNPTQRKKCANIPHGTIHATEANGMCIKTPTGNIIVLSYALRHFLFYMNLFHFGHQLGIKEEDIFHSMILAFKIIAGKESLDFELDSRGDLPKEIKDKIDYYTNWQMKFIIGHEYAHHYLDHLQKNPTITPHEKIFDKEVNIKYFTHKQKKEFEADYHAIAETTYDDFEKGELLDGAFLFFLFLHIFYKVDDYYFPKIGNSYTHPSPVDRIIKLRKSIKEEIGASEEVLTGLVEHYDKFMASFINDNLVFQPELVEDYGSTYLPSYKTQNLIDRLDY